MLLSGRQASPAARVVGLAAFGRVYRFEDFNRRRGDRI